jgi:hypothetical protein
MLEEKREMTMKTVRSRNFDPTLGMAIILVLMSLGVIAIVAMQTQLG